MGFFIGQGKKGKANKAAERKKRKGGKRGGATWDPRRTLAAVRWLAAVAVVVGLVLAWVGGERALRRYVSEHRAAAIGPGDVEVVTQPDVSQEVKARLRATVADYVSADPLDGQGLVEATRALERDPWVARVEQVERVSTGAAVSGSPRRGVGGRAGGGPDASLADSLSVGVGRGGGGGGGGEGGAKVRVMAEVRVPVARVWDGERYRLVDREGRWLPWDGRMFDVPAVTGVKSASPGEPGAPWGEGKGGDDVSAAVAAVRMLSGEAFAGQVLAYDVGDRDGMGRVQVVLHTRHGRVVWGLAPGREGAIEPEAVAKRDRLRELGGPRGDWPLNARSGIVYVNGATIEFAKPTGGAASATVSY